MPLYEKLKYENNTRWPQKLPIGNHRQSQQILKSSLIPKLHISDGKHGW